jgi:hypothetical protein
MDPRGVHNKANATGKPIARVIGDDTSKLKIKLKKY